MRNVFFICLALKVAKDALFDSRVLLDSNHMGNKTYTEISRVNE